MIKGKLSADRAELTGIPSSFLPFLRVEDLSPTAIRLGQWPRYIYAGTLHTTGHKVQIPDHRPIGDGKLILL